MNIGKFISNIQFAWNSGPASSDNRLSDRFIYSKLLQVKSDLLYTKYRKQKIDSYFKYKTLSCIEMIDSSMFECPCVPIKGCIIKRSKYKLPKVIPSITGGDSIESVRTIDGNKKFNKSSIRQQQFKGDLPYNLKDIADYWIDNEYLYLTYTQDTEILERIRMSALFYDDIEVEEFLLKNNCIEVAKNECKSAYDFELSIDPELILQLEIKTLEIIYKSFNIRPVDYENNNRDETLK